MDVSVSYSSTLILMQSLTHTDSGPNKSIETVIYEKRKGGSSKSKTGGLSTKITIKTKKSIKRKKNTQHNLRPAKHSRIDIIQQSSVSLQLLSS